MKARLVGDGRHGINTSATLTIMHSEVFYFRKVMDSVSTLHCHILQHYLQPLLIVPNPQLDSRSTDLGLNWEKSKGLMQADCNHWGIRRSYKQVQAGRTK